MSIKINKRIFHFESLVKGNKAFKKACYCAVSTAVRLNGNSALAVIHPGFCREIVKDRIEHSVYPPIVFDTIRNNEAECKEYMIKLSKLIRSTEEPVFIFSEWHCVDKMQRWMEILNPKAPVILVNTWIGMPVPLDGWDTFIKPCKDLKIKYFNGIGEMAININNENCGCPSIFYDNIKDHFKTNLLTDYTFPNLYFETSKSKHNAKSLLLMKREQEYVS